MYTLKVNLACEHSRFKNMDLVAIQHSDPQARILNSPVFEKGLIYLEIVKLKNCVRRILSLKELISKITYQNNFEIRGKETKTKNSYIH